MKFFDYVDHFDSEVKDVLEVSCHGRGLKIKRTLIRYACTRKVLNCVLVLIPVVFEMNSKISQSPLKHYPFSFIFFSDPNHLNKPPLPLNKMGKFEVNS